MYELYAPGVPTGGKLDSPLGASHSGRWWWRNLGRSRRRRRGPGGDKKRKGLGFQGQTQAHIDIVESFTFLCCLKYSISLLAKETSWFIELTWHHCCNLRFFCSAGFLVWDSQPLPTMKNPTGLQLLTLHTLIFFFYFFWPGRFGRLKLLPRAETYQRVSELTVHTDTSFHHRSGSCYFWLACSWKTNGPESVTRYHGN